MSHIYSDSETLKFFKNIITKYFVFSDKKKSNIPSSDTLAVVI